MISEEVVAEEEYTLLANEKVEMDSALIHLSSKPMICALENGVDEQCGEVILLR